MHGRHKGPDVLHLHASAPLENEGGPRTRVLLSWNGGFRAHVSCLAEQAKILVAEAEENNLSHKTWNERWFRWYNCSLCEQSYHGVVWCALGWACWKTYVGRPETDWARGYAMEELANGLSDADHHEDALSVQEAELAMKRRLGDPENNILAVQSNIANSYEFVGRLEEALPIKRDVYFGYVKLFGNQDRTTLVEANNYGLSLCKLGRVEEAKSWLRKMIPVARRVLDEADEVTLNMRKLYGMATVLDPAATLDDLREAATTLEEMARIARRVLGGAHPLTSTIERDLRLARAKLRARETQP